MVILDLKTKIHACRWCIFWSSKGVFEHYKKDFCKQYENRLFCHVDKMQFFKHDR